MVGSDWIAAALKALGTQGAAVLVTQCVVEGSAPREAGARMLVTADGFQGTIGGGNLEHHVLDQARALLGRAELACLLQDYPLGPLLSQCCGGHVRILLERLTADDVDGLAEVAREVAKSGGLVLETRLSGDGLRRRVLASGVPQHLNLPAFADASGTPLMQARPPRSACAFYRAFVGPPLPPVYVFGAGHVGRALIQVLAASEMSLHWFDGRPEYEGGMGAVPVQRLNAPGDTVATLPPGAICLVLTHAHELDYEIVRAVLRREDIAFCGLIGSGTKRARFLRRLAADGAPAHAIARLVCPIGLPGIEGKTPFAIALSVAAQLNAIAGQPVRGVSGVLE